MFQASIPRVSVVMPSYNAQACIGRAIESVLAQTMQQFELIVVDDASTDGTQALVHAITAKDSRIKHIALSSNRGPAYARNVGIAAARGEWIGLLDADDAWRTDRLDQLLRTSGTFDAVFDNLVGYDSRSRSDTDVLIPEFHEGELTIARLLGSVDRTRPYDLGYLKPLIRREFLLKHGLKYNESLRTNEDLLLYLELLARGGRAHTVNVAAYVYTIPTGADGSASAFSNTVPRDDELRRALQGVLQRDAERLSVSARHAIAQRIAVLKEVGPLSEFYHAWTRRAYGRMARLFLLKPAVRHDVTRKVTRRLLSSMT